MWSTIRQLFGFGYPQAPSDQQGYGEIEGRLSQLEDAFSAFQESTKRRLNTYGMRYARDGGANGAGDMAEVLRGLIEAQKATKREHDPFGPDL